MPLLSYALPLNRFRGACKPLAQTAGLHLARARAHLDLSPSNPLAIPHLAAEIVATTMMHFLTHAESGTRRADLSRAAPETVRCRL